MELEYKITEEALQALFEGKKVIFDYQGRSRITLYPPRYGVFITHEKMRELEDMAYSKAFMEMTKLLVELKKEDSKEVTN
jgi:hypothetical protein